MNIKNRNTPVMVLVGLLLLPALAIAQQPATKQKKEAGGFEPFRAGEKLPLLRTKLIEPARSREAFKINGKRSVSFPREPGGKNDSLPDLKAKGAEKIFRDWIQAHFGELPAGTTLVREEEQQPATLQLSLAYRGIAVDGRAILESNPDGVLSGYFDLLACEEDEGTAQVSIDSHQAVATWRKILSSPDFPDETRAHFEKYAHPKLVYVWSPPRFAKLIGSEDLDSVLSRRAPTWCVDGDVRMVDCHTGKPWVND